MSFVIHSLTEKPLHAIEFTIKDVDVSIVNSIRRVISSEIPNVACQFDPINSEMNDIHILENTSALNNEFFAHRISLVPINFSEKSIKAFEADPSKMANYKFVIQMHNTTKEIQNVTTDDIRVYYKGELNEKKRDAIFPRSNVTSDPILLNVLHPNLYNPNLGEKLHVEFRFRLGTAAQYAGFSPVSKCSYYNSLDHAKGDAALQKQYEMAGNTKKEEIKKRFDIKDRYRYFLTNEYNEPNSFEFSIESECKMSPKYIFEKAIDVLVGKIETILNTKKSYEIESLDRVERAYAIKIQNQQHTLGNMIQAMFYNAYIRNPEEKGVISYIGYYLVHPLLHEIIVKMTFVDQTDTKEVDTFFRKGLKRMMEELVQLKNEWNKI